MEEQDYNNIKIQVQELMDWKNQKERQQISFPLDTQSVTILNKYFLRVISQLNFINSSGGEVPNILTLQDGVYRGIPTLPTLYQYGANPTNNLITVSQGSFVNMEQIQIYTTGDFPSPLSDIEIYRVMNVDSTGRTFHISTLDQSSLTSGLSAGATSATLASTWGGNTGSYLIEFGDGEYRTSTLTNGSASFSWSPGLANNVSSGVYTSVDITSIGTGQQFLSIVT